MWGSSVLEYKNSIFLKTIFQHLSSFLNPAHSILEYKQQWTVVLHVYQYHSSDQQNWGSWGVRRQISFLTLQFAQHMNLAMHVYTQSHVHAVRSRTDLGFAGSSARNRTSCPLRENDPLGIFNLNIILETKLMQYQGKVKKEKDHTAHHGKSDSKTERMMVGSKGRWTMRLPCRL